MSAFIKLHLYNNFNIRTKRLWFENIVNGLHYVDLVNIQSIQQPHRLRQKFFKSAV